jgi:hypothetical protein
MKPKLYKGNIRYSVCFDNFCLSGKEDFDFDADKDFDEWEAVLSLRDCCEVDFAYYAVFTIDWDTDIKKHADESIKLIENIINKSRN